MTAENVRIDEKSDAGLLLAVEHVQQFMTTRAINAGIRHLPQLLHQACPCVDSTPGFNWDLTPIPKSV